MPLVMPAATCFPIDLLVKVPTDVPGRQWLIACTMPRQEKSLANDLLRRGIPFYLPLESKTVRSRGRTTTSHLPVLSGFLFLYADDRERTAALSTGRISAFLKARDGDKLQNDLRKVEASIRSGNQWTSETRGLLGENLN